MNSPVRFLATIAGLLAASTCALAQSYCFGVTVTGSGKPVILIPGIACGGDVWDNTVAALKTKYECHVLSLPGFAGKPPMTDASGASYLGRVRYDILAYVKDKHLDHPAIIGHSLGGALALELAEADPTLWGPVISVNGLPCYALAVNPHATPDSIKKDSEAIAQKIAVAPANSIKAGIHASLIAGIGNPSVVEAMYAKCSLTDQPTLAEAWKESLATDLRPKLGSIQSPVLIIGAGFQASDEAQKKALTETFQKQIKAIPHSRLAIDWSARQFVMLDDPKGFVLDVETFLSH